MRLTKHHGLGNDFLVLLDIDGIRPIEPTDAVTLCDRRTGVGADGLLRVSAGSGEADITMELLNADGSVAEMSGNGIRCLAQAVFRAGLADLPTVRVATLAGLRTVTQISVVDAVTQRLQVDMGQAKVLGDDVDWVQGPGLRVSRVDVGNPHVVIEWGEGPLPTGRALVDLGERINAATPGGTNVELIRRGATPDTIDMVVFERGVGPTQACGTGACATAAAAQEWGLVGARSTVTMPGGPVDIELGDPVLLTGDATYVADVVTPTE
jgi:diaminopimelate epimerase